MYSAIPNRFAIVLTSDSNRKALRFLTSLITSLSETKSLAQWEIVVLRPLPYHSSPLVVPPRVASHLHQLNVHLVQPQIRFSTASHFDEFLFCIDGDSYSIAAQRNRGLLALNDLLQSTTVDLIAVLDDDLVFQNALLKRNQFGTNCVSFETTHDYLSGLETICALSQIGPIIGGSTGCPPVPGASAIKCAIEDIDNSAEGLSSTELFAAQEADYFYDFREHRGSDFARGAWLSYCYDGETMEPSCSNVFSGITPTRPVIYNKDRLLSGQEPSNRKGGNTYFAHADHLLPIPHLALCVAGLSTRRSDMIVAETASRRGIPYRKTYFPLGHLRIPNAEASGGVSMLRMTEAELFGAAFQRGITSFLAGGDHVRAWKDMFVRRFNQILEIYSQIDRTTLPVHVREKMMAFVAGDTTFISEQVMKDEESFFQKYMELLHQYSEVNLYWETLIKEHNYQVAT